QYADVLEQLLYNGILSGVALGGERFFYVNPLASDGKHHRQPFFPCACCPSNVVRFVPSVPGYVYAVGADRSTAATEPKTESSPKQSQAIFVNLYVAGTANIKLGDHAVKLIQETRYPWDGKVKLTVTPDRQASFPLYLRIPSWCREAKVSVAGSPVANPKIQRGYLRLDRAWSAGDVVELDLPMEIQRIEAHPRVKADAGRVAVQRGPVVYCFEAVDNGGHVKDLVLPRDPKFTAEFRKDLLGGVTVIKGVDRKGRDIMAVPYHVWDHRQAGEMAVWITQDGKPAAPKADDSTWQNKLYRPFELTPAPQ
ncbi:MAG: glycoside hydrolase family 127 protein, partial [Planctomycetes bacterium]|nr:glycoside hydrolase family 127 protein [Planctomycetota bacterium]